MYKNRILDIINYNCYTRLIKKQVPNINLNKDLSFEKQNDYKFSSIEKMSKFARSFFESIQVIVIALAIVVLVYLFVASFNIIDGDSMLPNFESRDLIIAEKITPSFGKLQRGDVIVFAATPGKDYIKRIIGLPGDKVKIHDGKVYINGNPLTENYLSDDNKYILPGLIYKEDLEIQNPDNNYFVMGDNRGNSRDSRDIGYVDKSKIKGHAWVVFWHKDKPQFDIVPHQDYTL